MGILQDAAADDALEQTRRAADAGWSTASATWCLFYATALLVVGAFAAAYFAGRTWRATKKELVDTREAQERLEASRVSAWLRGIPERPFDLCVRNGNEAPVYDVQVDILVKTLDRDEPRAVNDLWVSAVLPPASSETREQVQRRQVAPGQYVKGQQEQLAAGNTPTFDRLQDWQVWDGSKGSTGVTLELSFRDTKGIYWNRDWRGQLSRVATGKKGK